MTDFTATPVTATVGRKLDAALWNQQVRDLAKAFTDARSTYTPTLTSTGVAPNLGATGTASGRYNRVGKLVLGEVYLVFSGAGLAAGTGTYRVSLPTAALLGTTSELPVGRARLADSSGAVIAMVDVVLSSTGSHLEFTYSAAYPTGAQTKVQGTAPWTWAASDTISLTFAYEAA